MSCSPSTSLSDPDLRPLPSRDTGLNHQHSSRWALGTSYCRPDADVRPPTPAPPSPSRGKSINHHASQLGLGNSLCNAHRRHPPPIPASFRPDPPSRHHDTGLKHQPRISRALGTACVRLSSKPQHSIDQQRTPNSSTDLCRSLCSQLASSPHDHHRRRPCSQLARDRTTAHPAPTLRKPLLPTSKPAAHKLFQQPPGNVSPSPLYTNIN